MTSPRYFTITFLIATLVLLSSGRAAPLQAETVNCTSIDTLPAVISALGVYCFTNNLTTSISSGTAISITANNVVLDLNGFKLDGSGGGAGTTANGIAAFNRRNITIKNGTVKGFKTGISLLDGGASQGHVVEDIRADHNTIAGIQVDGRGNLIRNNQVVGTGGGTCCGTGTAAVGIRADGTGPRVLNNDVIDTTSPGDVASRGIQFPSSVVGGLAVNNRISNADIYIEFLTGATGKYRDNLTFGNGEIDGGTDAGNNN
jgi:hypothetical protein